MLNYILNYLPTFSIPHASSLMLYALRLKPYHPDAVPADALRVLA